MSVRSRPPFALVAAGTAAVAALVILVRVATAPNIPPRPSPVLPSPKAARPQVPPCRRGEVLTPHVGDDQWRRTLVDPRLALPRDYEPGDLVPVSRAGFAGDFLVRKPVIRDLAALREAAEAEGHDLGILAAYRSYREQDDLFEGRVGDLGKSETLAKTARPGHSEHQLGTAVDFRTASEPDVDAAWESTPEGAWVAANAWRFGFVMSYPRESRRVTCYVYEPWHFRYLGPAAARVIRERGVTVREYLWERQ